MSLFRLVLCLAGLAIYFLARQAVNAPPRRTEPGQSVSTTPQTHQPSIPTSSTNAVYHAGLLEVSSALAAQKTK